MFCLSESDSFNSRTPEGCDAISVANIVQTLVSIHAPLKGATKQSLKPVIIHVVSIHAPLKGATVTEILGLLAIMGFNSRTPEGCDRRSL